MTTLRIKHFILIIPISVLIHLSVHTLISAGRKQEESKTKHTTSFKEFYIQKLQAEPSDKTTTKEEFLPYLLVKNHKKFTKRLEKSGYSTRYLNEIFKEWFFERFGLIYEKDSITRHPPNKYIIKIQNPKKNKSHVVEKSERVEIFIEKDQSPNNKVINKVRSIVIPSPKRLKYSVKKRAASTFEVTPTNL